MQTNNNAARQQVIKGDISVRRVFTGEFQKEGSETAELAQTVITKSYYPSKKIASDLQANIFGLEDFGYKEQEFESTETRIAWIPVPKGTTVEQVTAKLATVSVKVIYKVLANKPILDDNQKYAIDAGLRTLDHFADAQAVRYPEGHEQAGKLILDPQGNVQYRRTFFQTVAQEDIDDRGNGEIYLSAAIKAELSGASQLQGQTV